MSYRSRQIFQIIFLIQIILLLNTDNSKVFAEKLSTNSTLDNISNTSSLVRSNDDYNITTDVTLRNKSTGFVHNTGTISEQNKTRSEDTLITSQTNETSKLDNQQERNLPPPRGRNATAGVSKQRNETVQYQPNNFTTPVQNVSRNSGSFSNNRTGSLNTTSRLDQTTNNSLFSGPTGQTNMTSNTSGLATNKPSLMYGNPNQTLSLPTNTTGRNATARTYPNFKPPSFPRVVTGRKNSSSWMDPNFDPTRWILKVQAPWKHVSGNVSSNETSVVQVCKFQSKYAICSAEYISSSVFEKLWLQVEESTGRGGVDVTAFERGHTPRVHFLNRANGTACQRFENGTFHQICVKVYGYDKALGPTRVCLQLGAALFNHGVTSSDFGCFRFGSLIRHEESMDGESPNPRLLNTYILSNNYANIIQTPVHDSPSASATVHPYFSSLASLLMMLLFLALY